ncbi:hypothetical protein I350_07364 [Cryptococcus amylolentus CBS 6273]|uniref:Mini-chromosome maintenance complex-binding protein n=1 Tax=Cryptococcus amylolentus CBS 6273 TaxID=1296118 RepID=A0A1E3JEV6_9TREE|nr:hypothetical protein I350_07364 [Cryptococcus amylolentus CBS 6273]
MTAVDDILLTALKEHEHRESDAHITIQEHIHRIKAQFGDASAIGPYSKSSAPLSVVSFKCLLQDTGYPMEVYLPGDMEMSSDVDWSKLKERWVGWGVEIPGEQQWTKPQADITTGLQGISIGSQYLPASVHAKTPLPQQGGSYLGALLKVYDDIAYKPASVHEFIGLLSTSPIPSNEPEDADIVPTIHVLSKRDLAPETTDVDPSDDQVREELIDYLSTAFNPPDRVAAEFLLLLLISSPTARPMSLPVLGTLAVNFRHSGEAFTSAFNSVVSSVVPHYVPLPLTLSLLHSHPFQPAMTDANGLKAGLLQLADGTVLAVEEDAMGNGGQLNEKALKNLKALVDCVEEQKVNYEYPYMDGLKMDCSVKVAVLSQGKSLIPVDVDIPICADGSPSTGPPSLDAFRSYLARYSSPAHSARLVIPDESSTIIQDHFVQERKVNPKDAEEVLKRRMKIARIVALSYPKAVLDGQVWDKTVKLDEEVAKRHTMS